MPTPLSYPTTIVEPFAASGDKNTIPTAPDSTPGHASLDLGFPPLTGTPIENGGVPPSRRDFNGIYNLITQHTAWVGAGGQYKFNATLVAFTGGYKLGAILQSDDGLSSYRSMVDNNTDNFNTDPTVVGTKWEAYAGQAFNASVTTIATTGGTVVLTTAQASASVIKVTGVLTSASVLQFPAMSNKRWTVTNATTSAFGMTAKLAAGASLTLTQGKTNTLFYDGAALVFPSWDSGLDSPALRGVPTAPTAAPLTNNNQVGTTAYTDAAIAAASINAAARYVNSAITAGPTGDLWTDTTAAAFTITLPDPPLGANPLNIRDIAGTWGTNNLTLNPGTKTVMGVAGNFICNVSGETFGLWWNAAANTWKVI